MVASIARLCSLADQRSLCIDKRERGQTYGTVRLCLSCNYYGTISHRHQFGSDINDDRKNLFPCVRSARAYSLSIRNLYLRFASDISLPRALYFFFVAALFLHMYVVVGNASSPIVSMSYRRDYYFLLLLFGARVPCAPKLLRRAQLVSWSMAGQLTRATR